MRITWEKSIVVLGRAIDAVGGLVFLKLLSSLADKSDVGTYLLASSYLAMVLTISFSAFDQGLLRNVSKYQKQSSLEARYSAMLASYLCLSAIFCGLCIAASIAFDLGASLPAALGPLSLWLAFEAIKNLNTTVASGLRSRSLIAGASAVDYGFRVALICAAHAWATVSTAAVLYLLAMSGLAASTLYLYRQRALLSRFSWSDVHGTLRDSIGFCWPMIVWGLFGWMQNMSNRWLLSHFTNLSIVAEYGVLVAIATFPVTALLGLVVTYIVPILYERENVSPGAARILVRRVALGLIPPSGLLVLLAAVWHRELTVLLSGASYTEHSHVLPFIMASACSSAVCSVLTYAVYAQRRVSALLLANTLPGVFSVAFGYLAIGRYHFDGAVLTLTFSHAIASVLFVVTFIRSKKMDVISNEPQHAP